MSDERDDDSFMVSLEVNNVNQVKAGEVIWVTPKINGHTLKMELDTGSAISTLPLQKYKDMFADTTGGHQSHVENLLRREDETRRKTPCLCGTHQSVEVELKRLEEEGILSKVNFCNWAMPIVPIIKPNGTARICGDYKITVNPQLQSEEYPLPRIDDIFAKLSGGEKFTKIDFRQAYHQMEVEEESQEYLTVNTHEGLYRYNHLVFGITSAPAIWQRSMHQILEGIEGTSCILDDMIITGKDDEEHLAHLEETLKRLKEHGLRANREKCEFLPDEDHLLQTRSGQIRTTQDSRES
ncbi:uncharacterized protein K02A2.6-like [Stylophora pistillata]|uniref:uncharacterized protein K02A2.6-like n=1 Tax=Stylophora pistillata TaxID=50429 RepID=UPI000C04A817|nr:uncharacterized protein K02A2.6-like [Stylophora pistillata]